MALEILIKPSAIDGPARQGHRVVMKLALPRHGETLLLNYTPRPTTLGEAFHQLIQPRGQAIVGDWAGFNIITYMLAHAATKGMEATLFDPATDNGTWFGTLVNLHHETTGYVQRAMMRDARHASHPIWRGWSIEMQFPNSSTRTKLDKFWRAELLERYLLPPYILARSFINGGADPMDLWREVERVNARSGDRLDVYVVDFLQWVYGRVQPIQFVPYPGMPPFEADRAIVQIEL